MEENNNLLNSTANRRTFIKGTGAAIGAGALAAAAPNVHAQGSDVIRVGLIGCGGRGTGAVTQILNHDHKGSKLVAVADAFMDKAEGTVARINKSHKDKVDVPKDRIFAGFDAYQKVIASDVDVIVLATPPGWRPHHLKAAIDAGKHVFMEKPVAVDGPGVRSVLESARKAKEKNLLLQVGLQRRHQPDYIETIKRLQDGAIGDIHYMRAFWNGGGVWTRPRTAEQNEMEYQMRNWYYFNWLCGDHITEQHIHNLDVINWLKDDYPVEAQGMGGRQVRNGIDHGEIYDHHFIEYKYADGTRMYSQCRHIKNCYNSVSESCFGSKGYADLSGHKIFGTDSKWRFQGKSVSGHQQEQLDLVDNLLKGNHVNEGEYGAKSTMTSILGRYASYSGKEITWDKAINTKVELAPGMIDYTFDSKPPVLPDADGRYEIAMPGITKPI